jgi:hypothetical protein
MNVSRSDRMTRVFVLDWEDLKRFLSAVSGALPKYSINAVCADRLNRSFESIDSLCEFGNPERCAITELKIAGLDERGYEKLSVTLNSDARHNVRIYVNAEDQIGISLNEIANDFIDSLRPWYSWVSRTDWYLATFGLWVLFWVISYGPILMKAEFITIKSSDEGFPLHALGKGVLLGTLPMFLGVALNMVRSRFFPMGFFAFGHGHNRHSRLEVIRTVVIVAFMISIISSVVVTWFQ